MWVEGNLFLVVREKPDPLSDLLICTNGCQILHVKKEGCTVVGSLSAEYFEMVINKRIVELKTDPLFPLIKFKDVEQVTAQEVYEVLDLVMLQSTFERNSQGVVSCGS